jgi:GTP-binding protein EngB required for normal cell division
LDETNKTINLAKEKNKPLEQIVEIKKAPKPNALPERIFKVCFLGDSAVGKTSFIMRYCMGQFYQSTSATLGKNYNYKRT